MRSIQRLFFLFLTLILILACHKDQTETNEDPIQGSALIEDIGAYWIYKVMKIDPNGVETDTGIRDTTRIIGDTLINGVEYVVYELTYLGEEFSKHLQRDSAGYIVNSTGNIIYSSVNFTDTLSEITTIPHSYHSFMIDNAGQQINVDAGTFFDPITMKTDVYRIDSAPVDTCGSILYEMENHYVSGIGLVQRNGGYISEMENCIDRRWDLIEYFIP